jgi:hypothetical protein
MAYLDNRSRVDGLIVLLTIPAVVFFGLATQAVEAGADASLDALVTTVNAAVYLSPVFVAIQVFKIWDGVAARSWQNWLCTLVTAAAAAKIWSA